MCVHTHTGKGVKKIGKYKLKSIPFWESQKAWVLVLQESGCVRSSLLDIMETSWVRAKFLYTYTWQCFSNSLKLCKGNVENKGWGCLQFRDFGFVGFFLPSEVCLQCEKLDWIMKQNICKHLPDKSPRVTYKVLVHLCLLFVHIHMHNVVFGRPSMTEKFQSACMNKYEQMFIRCSFHKWLAQFFCLIFKAFCPFLADKKQN